MEAPQPRQARAAQGARSTSMLQPASLLQLCFEHTGPLWSPWGALPCSHSTPSACAFCAFRLASGRAPSAERAAVTVLASRLASGFRFARSDPWPVHSSAGISTLDSIAEILKFESFSSFFVLYFRQTFLYSPPDVVFIPLRPCKVRLWAHLPKNRRSLANGLQPRCLQAPGRFADGTH